MNFNKQGSDYTTPAETENTFRNLCDISKEFVVLKWLLNKINIRVYARNGEAGEEKH